MKALTPAQNMFGKDFGNSAIITDRPASLRSSDPDLDKVLFYNYKQIRRSQNKFIKKCLQ